MTEWMAIITYIDRDDYMGIFKSRIRMIFRILRHCGKIRNISIRRIEPAEFAPECESPCETCLRWDECNGVDIHSCTE